MPPPYVDSPHWRLPCSAGLVFGARIEEELASRVRLSTASRHRKINASRHFESRWVTTSAAIQL